MPEHGLQFLQSPLNSIEFDVENLSFESLMELERLVLKSKMN